MSESYRRKTTCSQCGQRWRNRACGFTHAIIWQRIKERNRKLRRREWK